MKKVFVGVVLSGLCAFAVAQTYIGGYAGKSSYKLDDCASATLCEKDKGVALKLYFGSKLESPLHLGSSFSIDAVEMSLVSFGRATVEAQRIYPVADPDTGVISNVSRKTTNAIRARAITAAMVARWQVAKPAALLLRVGGAYVITSADEKVDGVTNGSAIGGAKVLRPYVGLGFELGLASSFKLTGGVDVTKYATGTSKGTLSLLGVGLQKDF